jgi:hypothetical protein
MMSRAAQTHLAGHVFDLSYDIVHFSDTKNWESGTLVGKSKKLKGVLNIV